MQSLPDTITEHALLIATQHGDRLALGALYTRYFSILHHDISTMLNDEDAEDVVHDVFTALCTTARRIRLRGTVRQYLFAAVRNRARDIMAHYRVRARLETKDGSDLGGIIADQPKSTDHEILIRELEDIAEHSLLRLAPRCREAIRHAESTPTYHALALILGVKTSTARTLLWRARRELRFYFIAAGWTELPRPQRYHGQSLHKTIATPNAPSPAPPNEQPTCGTCILRARCEAHD